MIQRIENIIMPKVKVTNRCEDSSEVLENFKCRRMVEDYCKEHLPETKAMVILWLDKKNLLSSAYCNVSPLDRLWVLFLAWFQELFDFRIDRHGKKDQ